MLGRVQRDKSQKVWSWWWVPSHPQGNYIKMENEVSVRTKLYRADLCQSSQCGQNSPGLASYREQ